MKAFLNFESKPECPNDKVFPRKDSTHGEDLYLLQLLCLCLTFAVCFQFHITMATHAQAATTSSKCPASSLEKRARVCLFIKTCSYLFAAWCPYSARGLKCSLALEQLRVSGGSAPGRGSSTARAQLEEDLLQADFWGPARPCWKEITTETPGRRSLLLDILV